MPILLTHIICSKSYDAFGIKIIDDNNYVIFTPIEIVDHESDVVWIVANNEDKSIKLIMLGHLFVKSGDKI